MIRGKKLEDVVRFVKKFIGGNPPIVKKERDIQIYVPKGDLKKYGVMVITIHQALPKEFTVIIGLQSSTYRFERDVLYRDLFGNTEKKYEVSIITYDCEPWKAVFSNNLLLNFGVIPKGESFFGLNIVMSYEKFKELVGSGKIYDLLEELDKKLKNYRVDIRETNSYKITKYYLEQHKRKSTFEYS